MLHQTLKQFFSKNNEYQRLITRDTINKHVLNAEYAVRGTISIRASAIQQILNSGQPHNFPFNAITECNIGNPHLYNQPAISFNREVLSCLLNPALIEQGVYHKDVSERAKSYFKQLGYSVGAYTESLGYAFVRRSVSQFIAKRDNLKTPTAISDLILTDGASQGAHIVSQAIMADSRDGLMIPVPQYPLYTAICALNNSSEVHYYLDEKAGWQVSAQELENSYSDARGRGITPRVLVVINPGNPTGQVLDRGTIESIIKFAHRRKMVIFADEVYQENIYTDKKKFVSFRKVKSEMEEPYRSAQMFSFHSTSKGLIGECGIRGGYVEMSNISQEVKEQLLKLKSIFLCSNSTGQLMTELMVNPPREGRESQETVQKYQKETSDIFNSLKKRAGIVSELLNQMTNIKCNEVEGAMYAFPRINFSQKVLEAAAQKGMEPDLFYCLEVLENTGIALVAGSGFRQEQGTYHFRITTLVRPDDLLYQKMKQFKQFNDKFHQKYN